MGGTEGRSGSAAVDVLRRVHARPSITRAELAGISRWGVGRRPRSPRASGRDSCSMSRLRRRREAAGGRRPAWVPIPWGRWCWRPRSSMTAGRCRSSSSAAGSCEPSTEATAVTAPDAVLRALTTRIREARAHEQGRLRAVGISFAGAVQDDRFAQVHNLGWRDVDVRPDPRRGHRRPCARARQRRHPRRSCRGPARGGDRERDAPPPAGPSGDRWSGRGPRPALPGLVRSRWGVRPPRPR